jgi:predicted nucleotidyltransferase
LRDRTMSLAGMHLAFEHAVSRSLAPDLVVRVAPPHVVTVLKMISYCERPSERERDLGDFVELLDDYVGDNDDRRFADGVFEADLAWEDVSAHELGTDVSRVVAGAERPLLEQFLTRARGGDALGTLARLLRVADFSREEREARLLRQLDAFARGLARSRGGTSKM